MRRGQLRKHRASAWGGEGEGGRDSYGFSFLGEERGVGGRRPRKKKSARLRQEKGRVLCVFKFLKKKKEKRMEGKGFLLRKILLEKSFLSCSGKEDKHLGN